LVETNVLNGGFSNMEFADHNKFDLRATRFQDVLDKAEKDGVGKVSIAGE